MIGAGEFKQVCLRLLDEVGVSGEPIVITKRGRPVAQLAPIPREDLEDWAGSLASCGRIDGDLIAPGLSPGEWDALRG